MLNTTILLTVLESSQNAINEANKQEEIQNPIQKDYPLFQKDMEQSKAYKTRESMSCRISNTN